LGVLVESERRKTEEGKREKEEFFLHADLSLLKVHLLNMGKFYRPFYIHSYY